MSARRGTCNHYTGFGPGKIGLSCAKGVDMKAVFGMEMGIMCRLPCFQESRRQEKQPNGKYIQIFVPVERRGQKEIPCSMLELPTAEAVAEQDAQDEAYFARTLLGIKIAGEWRVRPKPANDRHEIVQCPACKGKLHLTQSSYNGHVHGKCETEKCISWME